MDDVIHHTLDIASLQQRGKLVLAHHQTVHHPRPRGRLGIVGLDDRVHGRFLGSLNDDATRYASSAA